MTDNLRKPLSRKPWLLVVYPARGNVFYQHLASRIAAAGTEAGFETVRSSVTETLDFAASRLQDALVLVINPYECKVLDWQSLAHLNAASWKAAVAAESVGSQWYSYQLDHELQLDAFIDVGFQSQQPMHESPIPYRFLPNAPLTYELTQTAIHRGGQRPLPWTLVGHKSADRARLAQELTVELGTGFLFLPSVRPVREGSGAMSPAMLYRVLRKTQHYVWRSHHSTPYYESFRLIDAVLNGASPCKIADEWDDKEIPGVYADVISLKEAILSHSHDDLFDAACNYWRGLGSLSDQLASILPQAPSP